MDDDLKSTIHLAPYALLAIAGCCTAAPVIAAASGLAINILAPHVGEAWERSCRQFLVDPELRGRPLQGALQRAIKTSVRTAQRQWFESQPGKIEVAAAQRDWRLNRDYIRWFDSLKDELLKAAAEENLARISSRDTPLNLGADPGATAELLGRELIARAESKGNRDRAQFVANELPTILAQAFSDEVYGDGRDAPMVREAFLHLTTRMQFSSTLQNVDGKLVNESEIREKQHQTVIQLIQQDADQRRDQIIRPLEVILENNRRMLDELERLSEQFNAAQRAKARLVPAMELRWGTQIAAGDIRVPKWEPEREQVLPHEAEALSLFHTNHAIVIKGKPSAGKTHLAGKLIQSLADSIVVLPRPDGTPPDFGTLTEHIVVLYVDDYHASFETWDPLPWWEDLARVCGVNRTYLVITCRSGDYWDRMLEKRGSLMTETLPASSIFEIPHLGYDWAIAVGRRLQLPDDQIRTRFDGTIGSLRVDLNEMGEEYDRLARQEILGVSASRLLDAAKLLHSARQPFLYEEPLRAVCEQVLGNADLSNEQWRLLKERTFKPGFGSFHEGEFVVYPVYLERPEVVKYEPTAEFADLQELAALFGSRAISIELFYLGVAAHQDWQREDLAEAAWRQGMDLGHSAAAFNLGVLLEQRGDLVGAEAAWRQGMDLGHSAAAFNLGLLLAKILGRPADGVRVLRSLCVNPEPHRIQALTNMAEILHVEGHHVLARRLVQSEFSDAHPELPTRYELALSVLAFLHGTPAQQLSGLQRVCQRIEHGDRLVDWNLHRSIDRARRDQHPEKTWLDQFAKVIIGGASPATLGEWPLWTIVCRQSTR